MSDERRKPGHDGPAASAAGAAAVVEVLRATLAKPGLRRGVSALLAANQRGGFDCPGCAWPESAGARKTAEFCENGAKAIADEATRQIVDAGFFARWSIDALKQQTGRWLNEQGRLSEPVVRRPGSDHYEPIGWDEANALIASELNALESPDEAAFYTSGRASNEAAFLYQLFVRRFGTNNLPDCSNLCHESSGRALTEAIGSGKGTVRLEDFERADAIFIVGQNPGSNHPRMLATLQQAKRRGATIVSINPLDETGLRRFRNPQELSGYVTHGTRLADLHLPVRVNGDVAALKGLSKALLEAEDRQPGEILDHEFIAGCTAGFEAFRDDLERTSWSAIEAGSGLSRDRIEAAARIAIDSDAIICCWAMGLTQHRNAVGNIQEICNFLFLRGNLGRPGAGACPVRGHSNVQGDRTMGIWEKPAPEFLAALERQFDFRPPARHGFDSVDAVHAMHAGRVRAFVALGGNFMSAMPDDAFTAEALERCRLTVQVSTKLNRSHLYAGRTALILPTLGRTDIDRQPGGLQFVTCENSMGVVSRSAGRIEPVAATTMRSEVRIVAEMAEATLGPGSGIDWPGMADDYRVIRTHIAATIPGFADFEQRLEANGELELPHAVRDERRFETPDGRAQFTVHQIEPWQLPGDRLLMMTVRSHDQFNTTVYSDNDRYRGIHGSRRVVFMAAADIERLGLANGARVAITSHFGTETRQLEGFRVVRYEIPPGCVACYYPETNPLIPVGHVATGSNTPAYKSVVVSIRPLESSPMAPRGDSAANIESKKGL